MYKLLEPYGKMVEFLGEALGENVEVALHDLTSKEQEVVALANSHISGREVGAKLSNLSIHYLETKQYENHRGNFHIFINGYYATPSFLAKQYEKHQIA